MNVFAVRINVEDTDPAYYLSGCVLFVPLYDISLKKTLGIFTANIFSTIGGFGSTYYCVCTPYSLIYSLYHVSSLLVYFRSSRYPYFFMLEVIFFYQISQKVWIVREIQLLEFSLFLLRPNFNAVFVLLVPFSNLQNFTNKIFF